MRRKPYIVTKESGAREKTDRSFRSNNTVLTLKTNLQTSSPSMSSVMIAISPPSVRAHPMLLHHPDNHQQQADCLWICFRHSLHLEDPLPANNKRDLDRILWHSSIPHHQCKLNNKGSINHINSNNLNHTARNNNNLTTCSVGCN